MTVMFPRANRSRHGRASSLQPIHEINVTPFVDVMLVLLIVFMITAPLLAVGVPVSLPESTAKPLPSTQAPLILSINKKGEVYVQDKKTPLSELGQTLARIRKLRPEATLFLRADKDIQYGTVVQVMAVVQAARFSVLRS